MKLNLLLFALLLYATVSAQFRVVGNIEFLNNQTVYLNYLNDNLEQQTDSTTCSNGVFIFKGNHLFEATHAKLRSADDSINTEFFFERGNTTLTGDITVSTNCMAAGGRCTHSFTEYVNTDAPFMPLRDSFMNLSFAARQKGDTIEANYYKLQFDSVVNESKKAERAFLKKHTDSPVSAYIISQLYMHPGTWSQGDSLMKCLGSDIQKSKYARYRAMMIDKWKSVEPGKPVLPFAQDDTTGHYVYTKQFIGQCYLIDFWASWCESCRKENLNLLKTYHRFHKKGFDILGVSLDDDRNQWISAIQKDQLPWAQVSDLKGWNNAAASLYAVRSIPTNFLINKKGVIVARSLSADELNNKLEELLDK